MVGFVIGVAFGLIAGVALTIGTAAVLAIALFGRFAKEFQW